MSKLPSIPDLRWVVVNSSGGKDSQTALRVTLAATDAANIPRSHVVVAHADLGRMEWKGTKELAQAQAAHHGLRFLVSRYRDADGNHPELLDYVRRRRKWPSSTTRYCTSEFKRSPCGRLFTQLSKEAPGAILNVYGFRAEESPARAKRKPLSLNARFSRPTRPVHDWLPIHDWTEREVWDDIRASGVPHHPAYDLGMPRLSCVFCIFAPRAALITAGTHNPELLDEYCALEAEIGHDFQHGKPIREVRDAIRRGERPSPTTGAWNM